MSDARTKVPPEFEGLTAEERIRRVQDLWDFIAKSPAEVPVPETHKRILDARLAEFETDRSAGTPWPEVRDKLLKRLQGD